MVKDSTPAVLLENLLELLKAQRKAFRQERSYWRAVGLVFGEIFNLGRHTVTQGLMTLGLTDGDWSSWYRLFSHGRYAEEKAARVLFQETVGHTKREEPYVVGVDGVQLPRSSLKLPGTSWLKAPRTPVFRVGIHRAQRYVHGAWLTPMEAGYSRALPLRFLPAFPPKARPSQSPPQREWEAGLVCAGRTGSGRAAGATPAGVGRWLLRYSVFLGRSARAGRSGRSNSPQSTFV